MLVVKVRRGAARTDRFRVESQRAVGTIVLGEHDGTIAFESLPFYRRDRIPGGF